MPTPRAIRSEGPSSAGDGGAPEARVGIPVIVVAVTSERVRGGGDMEVAGVTPHGVLIMEQAPDPEILVCPKSTLPSQI